MSFNKVILMGNLTRDPEVRTTPSGLAIAKFGLAVSRKRKDKDEVCFVDVTAFDKTAEVVGNHFVKGKPILLEGRLNMDQWEDKNTGERRSKLGVIMDGFAFVGGRDEGAAPETTRWEETGHSRSAEDDVPF